MDREINNHPTSNNEDRNDLHDMYVDERTKEKVRKHYSDKNDKITEQDIANVNTDIYEQPASEEEEKNIEERLDDDVNKKAPTAWDISTDE